MLTTIYEYTADVWHWKAGRGNPVGWVDDAIIDPTQDNICAIAVLDDELYWDHSVSSKIKLRFVHEKGTEKE